MGTTSTRVAQPARMAAAMITPRRNLAVAAPAALECGGKQLILTQKNPCWTCIVNPLDLLDFQGFDGRGRPTDLPPKPATRLCTGLLGGFGCLAHVFLGKDEGKRSATPLWLARRWVPARQSAV